MQTRFTSESLADPAMKASEAILRACVHCGFCTATCPTYVLLGDELDSPRGRIYLIKDMLENGRKPSPQVVKHIDRCLSCLSCMTTCPSGVNYMHLVDHARAYIAQNYRRPLADRIIRAGLQWLLPHPARFRLGLRLGLLARPLTSALRYIPGGARLTPMLAMLPAKMPRPLPPVPVAQGPRGRVLMLQGCVEPVLRPEIRAAALRVLMRIGFEPVFAAKEGCCGALVQHMGAERDALAAARANIDAWTGALQQGLSAIVVTASGCGTQIKDYGHMLRDDPAYAERAAQVSALARDISEVIEAGDLTPVAGRKLKVAYHPACSLQHGQKVTDAPKRLLTKAGFDVVVPAEAHLCCGSAGTYNLLQPAIAGQLGDRKAGHIAALGADVLATGNIGCATQIGQRVDMPVVHTIELLDWATGGDLPPAMANACNTRTKP